MFKLILLPFTAFTLIFNCTDTHDIEPAGEEFTWLVGNEDDSVSRDFEVPADTKLHLEIERGSLCPNSGVYLEVWRDGEISIEQVVQEDREFQLSLQGGTNLRIMTVVRLTDEQIDCVWLGNAEISGSY